MLAKRYRLQIQDWLKNRPACAGRNKKIISRKSDFFIMKASDNDLNFSRFGVVISAKVSKLAVKRNKIRRIIYDFIRLNNLYKVGGRPARAGKPAFTGLPAQAGRDVVITVLFATAKLERSEIEKQLNLLLHV